MKTILFFIIVLTIYVSSLCTQTTGNPVEKSCPSCNKTYTDEHLYCPQDGSKLISQTNEKDTSEKTQEVKTEKSQETTESSEDDVLQW